jgi:hypothetical protein
MKKLIIVFCILLSNGLFVGCTEDEVTPADEHGTMEKPSDNGL